MEDLLTEICKRGCTIEIRSSYPTDHLPKCLVKINDGIIWPEACDVIEFKINSIIPASDPLYYIRQRGEKKNTHLFISYNWPVTDHLDWNGQPKKELVMFELTESDIFCKKNMRNLDFLTHYLYTDNNEKKHLFYYDLRRNTPHKIKVPLDKLASYSQNLIPVMIQDLINHHILELLRGLNCNLEIPKEIKLLIVNMLMGLNCWNKLGIYIDFCA